ncbi:hypothetical protein QL285_004564 [Trifolium repens]|nr:hypothetical protein QL285_004564 [Trifolium repens]
MVPADLNRSVVKLGKPKFRKAIKQNRRRKNQRHNHQPRRKKRMGGNRKGLKSIKPTHEMEKPKPGFEKPTPIVKSGPAKGTERNHERRR